MANVEGLGVAASLRSAGPFGFAQGKLANASVPTWAFHEQKKTALHVSSAAGVRFDDSLRLTTK